MDNGDIKNKAILKIEKRSNQFDLHSMFLSRLFGKVLEYFHMDKRLLYIIKLIFN